MIACGKFDNSYDWEILHTIRSLSFPLLHLLQIGRQASICVMYLILRDGEVTFIEVGLTIEMQVFESNSDIEISSVQTFSMLKVCNYSSI